MLKPLLGNQQKNQFIISKIEATAAIRRDEAASCRSRVPIIAMTAHAMDDDRRRCLETGMDGFISKPIDPAAMLEMIKAHQVERS